MWTCRASAILWTKEQREFYGTYLLTAEWCGFMPGILTGEEKVMSAKGDNGKFAALVFSDFLSLWEKRGITGAYRKDRGENPPPHL